jgi:hypothetical protein
MDDSWNRPPRRARDRWKWCWSVKSVALTPLQVIITRAQTRGPHASGGRRPRRGRLLGGGRAARRRCVPCAGCPSCLAGRLMARTSPASAVTRPATAVVNPASAPTTATSSVVGDALGGAATGGGAGVGSADVGGTVAGGAGVVAGDPGSPVGAAGGRGSSGDREGGESVVANVNTSSPMSSSPTPRRTSLPGVRSDWRGPGLDAMAWFSAGNDSPVSRLVPCPTSTLACRWAPRGSNPEPAD